MTTRTKAPIQISLILTPEQGLSLDAPGGENVNRLDQCRALMLGIYALIHDELGVTPDQQTLDSLADWAETVMER